MTAIKNTAQHLKNTHNKTFLVISESLSCPHIPLRDFLPHAAPWWWTASTAPGPPRLRGPSGKVPKDHGSKSRAVWRGFGVVELYFHQCQYQSVDWKWLWAEAERQTEETDTLISVKLKCSKTFYTLWPNSLLSFRVRMKLQTSAKCKNWWQSSVCSYVSFKIWWNNDEIMWKCETGRFHQLSCDYIQTDVTRWQFIPAFRCCLPSQTHLCLLLMNEVASSDPRVLHGVLSGAVVIGGGMGAPIWTWIGIVVVA